ncbi:hypothetical protein [Enterococcus casseliflavus]|uniref:hypothetical protein n=1 Tax=Enterococcus casseliflavus TaxID=37734 RepID=UPI001F1003BA|nr:hypothetical protein [Enterococcus casseliflavus]
MGRLFIGNKAVGEFDAARVTGCHVQLSNLVSFDVAPQLNENQNILLEWLKSSWLYRSTAYWHPFEVVAAIPQQFEAAIDTLDYIQNINNERHLAAYGKLKHWEQFQVLQAFSQWALEQEEA